MISAIPPRWRYGEAGDRYPVQPGEVWQVGAHTLGCGDIEQGALAALLARYPLPGHAYVDPPWTPALASGFRTKAGVPRKVDFLRFLETLLEGLRPISGYLAIEMGRDYVSALGTLITTLGGYILATWPITYYRKHPATLTVFSWSLGQPPLGCDLTGMDDAVTPTAWFAAMPRPYTVLDPCLGTGLTARAAQHAGWSCLGLELHPRRMAVALEELSKLGAGLPLRVGQFWTPQ